MRDLLSHLTACERLTDLKVEQQDPIGAGSGLKAEMLIRSTIALERIATALEHANEQNDALLNLGPRYARSDA
jgi:hypothetical protein